MLKDDKERTSRFQMDVIAVRRAGEKRALALCALMLALLLTGCQKAPEFVGRCVANEGDYLLEYEVLNAVRSTEMALETGDDVRVQIDAASGTLNLLVYPSGHMDEPIYRADGAESGEFLLTISSGGAYTFRVEGRNAKGSVRFTKER